ncbi:MAG: BrnT family toxin [Chloroflexota bacterium]
MMKFEWDENKRLTNLEKHGLDFRYVDEVFEDVHVTIDANQKGDERRYLVIGKLDSKFVTVIYTPRGDKYRIISMRRSRNGEKRKYHELYGN